MVCRKPKSQEEQQNERALSSTYLSFHNEVQFLKNFFTNNGYSSHLFSKLVNKFLCKRYQPTQLIPTVRKEEIYISLPYLGEVSKKLQQQLKNGLTKFYPQLNFNFIHTNSFKISSFFHYKDRLPSELRSSVVYCFTCSSCRAEYIGSTSRAFKIRYDEHVGQSSRTGRPFQSPPHSAVRDHSSKCKRNLSQDDFKILDMCQPHNLRILESLHIASRKPSLNDMQSAAPLNII